ncbi:hypothetical protein [Flagellimonas olearia]|nr:hypothetical protein [Allomuricauda olearia]
MGFTAKTTLSGPILPFYQSIPSLHSLQRSFPSFAFLSSPTNHYIINTLYLKHPWSKIVSIMNEFLNTLCKSIPDLNDEIKDIKALFIRARYSGFNEKEVIEIKDYILQEEGIGIDEFIIDPEPWKGKDIWTISFLGDEVQVQKKNILLFLDMLIKKFPNQLD